MFFDLQVRINLLDEVNSCSHVDNQQSSGTIIAGFRTCCLEAGSSGGGRALVGGNRRA
jgi:hypothetical protein